MINPQLKRRIIDAVLRDIEADRAIIEKFITLKNRLEDVLDNADGLIDLSISNMALLPYIAEIRQEQATELELTNKRFIRCGMAESADSAHSGRGVE